jgi:hypothetical protein
LGQSAVLEIAEPLPVSADKQTHHTLNVREINMGQRRWFFCNKCHGLFFDPDGSSNGICPASGEHDHTQPKPSFEFDLPHDVKETDKAQEGWRFCAKCNGMFFNKAFDASACPKGGGHEAQGFNFVLNHDVPLGPNRQSDWLFCEKCHGMFFKAPTPGNCPKDHQGHKAARNSFHFVLDFIPL